MTIYNSANNSPTLSLTNPMPGLSQYTKALSFKRGDRVEVDSGLEGCYIGQVYGHSRNATLIIEHGPCFVHREKVPVERVRLCEAPEESKEPEESKAPESKEESKEESNDFCREVPVSAVIAARVGNAEQESEILVQRLDDLLPTTPNSEGQETPGAPKKGRGVLTPGEVDRRFIYFEDQLQKEELTRRRSKERADRAERLKRNAIRRAFVAEQQVAELNEHVVHLEEIFGQSERPHVVDESHDEFHNESEESSEESENEADIICGDAFPSFFSFWHRRISSRTRKSRAPSIEKQVSREPPGST